jgi:endonuclease-3
MPHPDRWPLREVITRLEAHYGRPKRPYVTDPFEMILWEAAAYLVPDERRRQVYDRLVREIGTDPARLAGWPRARLAALIAEGGMQPERRAEKVRMAADLVLEIGLDELRSLIRTDPKKAKIVLRKFPGIGEPGAEKILLFNGSWKGLAPDSNALRVLNRLGFGTESENYGKTYRSAGEAVAPELPKDPGWLISAHQLLRRHGQVLCKTNAPKCGVCPLANGCPSRV